MQPSLLPARSVRCVIYSGHQQMLHLSISASQNSARSVALSLALPWNAVTQALAAAAYMLLALYQPWRLLAGLPPIDTSSARVTIIIPVSCSSSAC